MQSLEILTSLSTMQATLWPSVSLTCSEGCSASISLENPLTIVSAPSDVQSELVQPLVIIQFAFASMPENEMIIVVNQDEFASLATAITGNKVTVIDETSLVETRFILESVVQGLCIAVGNVRNESILASGLNIRHALFSLPSSLAGEEELMRTNVAMTCDGSTATLIWLMDTESAGAITQAKSTSDASDQGFGAATGPFSMPAFGASQVIETNPGLDLLMDIPLEISVELGRTRMQVRDVVDLGAGSIIEIDKAAGEPVDVLVNGRLVAKGEVVVIDDNFGVRITEILTQQERLQRLNDAA